MKIKIASTLVMVALISLSPFFQKSAVELISQDQPPSIMELAFLRELGPSILETMELHGDRQLFTSERIEKIVRNQQADKYDVTLRVIGYEGPFNPPYKLIRMTFQIPGEALEKYKVVDYERTYITSDEVKELSKYSK